MSPIRLCLPFLPIYDHFLVLICHVASSSPSYTPRRVRSPPKHISTDVDSRVVSSTVNPVLSAFLAHFQYHSRLQFLSKHISTSSNIGSHISYRSNLTTIHYPLFAIRQFCVAMDWERGNDHHLDAALGGMLMYENNLRHIIVC